MWAGGWDQQQHPATAQAARTLLHSRHASGQRERREPLRRWLLHHLLPPLGNCQPQQRQAVLLRRQGGGSGGCGVGAASERECARAATASDRRAAPPTTRRRPPAGTAHPLALEASLACASWLHDPNASRWCAMATPSPPAGPGGGKGIDARHEACSDTKWRERKGRAIGRVAISVPRPSGLPLPCGRTMCNGCRQGGGQRGPEQRSAGGTQRAPPHARSAAPMRLCARVPDPPILSA